MKEVLQCFNIPLAPIKTMFMETSLLGRWAKWLVKIKEFDFDIKPIKIVNDQFLYKLIIESKLENLVEVE